MLTVSWRKSTPGMIFGPVPLTYPLLLSSIHPPNFQAENRFYSQELNTAYLDNVDINPYFIALLPTVTDAF